MQFFVRNPQEGHTKLIRNIPVTTNKLIYEIVINFDIFAVGMLLHINRKFTKGKLQSSHLLSFVLNRWSLLISRWFNSDVDPEKC